MFTDTKHKRDSGGQADSAFSDNDSSDDSDSKLFIKQEDRNKKLHYDSSDDSNSDEQEDSDIESDVDDKNDSQTQIKSEESSESEESDSSEEEKKTSDTSAVNWKTNLAQKAADAFIERQASTANLWKLVYGKLNFVIELSHSLLYSLYLFSKLIKMVAFLLFFVYQLYQ